MTSGTSDSAAAGEFLAAALGYLDIGWHVFPCKPSDKTPLTGDGFKAASLDVDQVREWWTRWPTANIGVACGASGLLVIDIDPRHGGNATFKLLEQRHGRFPRTCETITGGGGRHLIYAANGTKPAATLGPGVDVKSAGGYIIVPPSQHASGHAYTWHHAPTETRPVAAPTTLTAMRPAAPTALPGEPIVEGNRHASLVTLAAKLRRAGLEDRELGIALLGVNAERCLPPLPSDEVLQIADDLAARAGDHLEPFKLVETTAAEICRLPAPPASDELLGPLVLRRQRLILGGHTGEGKSTLALAMMRAIVNGEQLLGFQGSGGCRGLVLDAEQGLRTVQRRLREAGLDHSDRIDYIRVPDGLNLDADERHIAAVTAQLERGQYAIVIADPLYKLHRGDSNAEREAVDLMRRFDAWRDELGFALALPVHCRKPVPGTRFSIHDLFGSSAYVRGAEVVLGLQRLRDGYSRIHFLKDRDGDLPIGEAWGLLFSRDQGYERDPHDGEKKPTAADRIRDLLEQQPGVSIDQLVTATTLADRTVRKALDSLGAISERGAASDPKRWRLPDSDTPP